MDNKPVEISQASLAAVAVRPDQYPPALLPEFAFVGKSNVGKSSLLNAMVNRKALARTSNTPGKTRTINFYNVENRLQFVDLPGYGYAKISRSESEKWARMIENYLKKRPTLRAIVFLVDIRHEPGANDRMMYGWLRHYQYEVMIVATKADKIKRSATQKQLALLRRALEVKEGLILPFSSETREGREELWREIFARVQTSEPTLRI